MAPRDDRHARAAWRALAWAGLATGLVAAGRAILWAWDGAGFPAATFQAGLAGHGPDDRAWPRLFAVWLPAACGLFTLGHAMLARGAPVPSRYRRLDALSYLLVPAFVVLVRLGPALPDWRLWLGGAYLAVVVVKAAILLRAGFVALVAGAREGTGPPALGGHLFATALLVYTLTNAYLATAVSTTGDEPYYLLVAASLVRDRDLDLANQFARQEYLPFYWGRLHREQNTVQTPSGAVYSVTYSGLLAFLLVPGYALGGRLGAMTTMAIVGAALMVVVFRLAEETTGSRRAAYATWLVLAFVPPVSLFASQLYPELLAALLTAWALRLCRRLPAAPGRHLPRLAVCLLALVLLKARYAALAVPLAGVALWRLRATRIAAVALLGAVALAAVALGLDWGSGGLLYARYLRRIPADVVLVPRLHMLQSLLGFLVDQEFGLLVHAPVYLLAILGLPWALRREPGLGLFLVAAACYVYPFLHSFEWFGGFSPPFRYLVCLVPLLALPLAHTLAAARGGALAAVALAAWLASLGIGLALTLRPVLRYNHGTGAAAWLAALGEVTAADLSRFLPTLVNPSPETPWLLGGLALALAGGAAVVRWRARTSADGPWFSPGAWAGAASLLVAVVAGLVAAGRTLPTLEVQGERMDTRGRGVFFPGRNDFPVKGWVMRANGSLSAVVRLREGPTVLAVRAGGYSTDGELPRLAVRLDEVPLGEVEVAAGRGEWRTDTYRFAVAAPGGPHHLTLVFDNALDRPAEGRVRHLLIDRVRVERPRE